MTTGIIETGVVLGHGVKFLAETHDVHAVLAERGADGRRGVGLPGRNLQLDLSCNFLCHKIVCSGCVTAVMFTPRASRIKL